jgi:hypothetical protein
LRRSSGAWRRSKRHHAQRRAAPGVASDAGRASEPAQSSAGRNAAAQRLAFTQLRDAIARGAPFATELAALRSAGAESAVSALAPIADAAPHGIPTLPTLASRFSATADAVLRADRAADTPWWWLPVERVRAMVSARPVGEAQGDSPGAIVARAQLRLNNGDLPAALRELEALRGAAAAAAAPWRSDATQRATADAVLARVGAELAGQ